jgi:DNA-binding NarL/FixJ family response regulator
LLRHSAAAAGYLLKDRISDVRTLCEAHARVAHGEPVIDHEVVTRRVGRARLDNPLDRVSDREREVFALMAEGLSHQGISDRPYVSTKSVDGHAGGIMIKLQLADSRDENRRYSPFCGISDADRTVAPPGDAALCAVVEQDLRPCPSAYVCAESGSTRTPC